MYTIFKAQSDLSKPYIGRQHFDWSWIEEKYPEADVVTMFRNPVSRAVSHFYFSRTLSFTAGKPIRKLSLSQLLTGDIATLHENRFFWQDGQGSV